MIITEEVRDALVALDMSSGAGAGVTVRMFQDLVTAGLVTRHGNLTQAGHAAVGTAAGVLLLPTQTRRVAS